MQVTSFRVVTLAVCFLLVRAGLGDEPAATAPSKLEQAKAELAERLKLAIKAEDEGKIEEYEAVDRTPAEWKVALSVDPDAMKHAYEEEKRKAEKGEGRYIHWTLQLLSNAEAKRKVSDDGLTFYIQPAHYPDSVWIIYQKIEGKWYRSETETHKAMHSTDSK